MLVLLAALQRGTSEISEEALLTPVATQAQAQMVELMEDIAQARQLFTAQRDGCAAQLDALAEEEAEYAQEQQQQQLPNADLADYAALQV